jgi:hypothetical protein
MQDLIPISRFAESMAPAALDDRTGDNSWRKQETRLPRTAFCQVLVRRNVVAAARVDSVRKNAVPGQDRVYQSHYVKPMPGAQLRATASPTPRTANYGGQPVAPVHIPAPLFPITWT